MSQPPQLGDHPFAIKEHESSFKHLDLRLHFSGQMVLSFVSRVPLHLDPARPIKLVRVGDHKLDYLMLEWIIPPNRPGAGPTALWDDGFFRVVGNESMALQLSRGRLRMDMSGKRLQGGFVLKWVGPQENDWLWVKEWDSFADPFKRFPDVLTPGKIKELEMKQRRFKDSSSLELF